MSVSTAPHTLSIAEAAHATGLTTHTLRYYERDELLLEPVERTPAGHRRYTEGDLTWIVLLTRLRATGMSIREMQEYAQLCRAGDGNEAQRLALLRAHRERVLAQLAAVQENLAAIEHKIALYEGRVDPASCRVDPTASDSAA